MGKITDFLTEVGKTVNDIQTLNVTTFSGDLNTVIDTTSLNTKNMEQIITEAATAGKLKLQASTNIELLGDTLTVVDTNYPTSGFKSIHESAVTTGEQARSAVIDAIKDLVD